jgi:SNF2 family DNA or RNA helicase
MDVLTNVAQCPVCYDATPNPRIVIPCGHDTCAECLTKISDQANQQNLADGNENGAASKCPTCRGSLSMNKIIDYMTFKRVHNPDPDEDDGETTSESSDDSETESEAESEDDVDDNGDLRNFIVNDDVEDETADEEDSIEGDEGDDEADYAPNAKYKQQEKKKKRSSRDKKGKKPEKKKEHVSIAMLKKEASRSAEGRRRYMRYLRKNWQPSAKVTKCVELLETFVNDGQKTIIFSQFVSLLDLLQVPIDEKRWNCLRYDGAMSADARDAAIQKFSDTQTHNIMLISLKAGNAGLNLVAASRVIILDPFWNPYIEMQAVDRAYRIGQQREVQVHRILIEGTVEDRIIELQEQKRKLVDSALDEGANKSLGRLDVRQLAFLFGVEHGN